jgi:hypothetical protein
MAKFCGNCGNQLNDTAVFCGGCGKPVPKSPQASTAQPMATPPAYSPQPVAPANAAPAFTPVAGYVPGAVAPPAKKSNTLLKVLVVCVVLLVVGTALAAAGMWYAAQKIKEKATAVATQAAGQAPGLGSVVGAVAELGKSVATSGDDSPTEFKGDPCRFLSTQEVSQAVGVTVIRAEGEDGNCSYIAKGDPADMAAKHMSSMVGGLAGPGMDAKSKKMIEGFAGGLFKQQEAQDKDLSATAAKGEIPVLGIMFTVGNAEAQMKLNRKSFAYATSGGGSAKSSGTGDLDGIGDEAYLAGGSMLMVRKGETIARFMYTSCPCNTDNIKPLAKLAVSRM